MRGRHSPVSRLQQFTTFLVFLGASDFVVCFITDRNNGQSVLTVYFTFLPHNYGAQMLFLIVLLYLRSLYVAWFPCWMLLLCWPCFPMRTRLLSPSLHSLSSAVTKEQSLPHPSAVLRLWHGYFHLLLHTAGADSVCAGLHQCKYMSG